MAYELITSQKCIKDKTKSSFEQAVISYLYLFVTTVLIFYNIHIVTFHVYRVLWPWTASNHVCPPLSCNSRSCYVVFPCQQIVLCLGCLMGLVMFARYGEDSPLDKGYVKTNDQVNTN